MRNKQLQILINIIKIITLSSGQFDANNCVLNRAAQESVTGSWNLDRTSNNEIKDTEYIQLKCKHFGVSIYLQRLFLRGRVIVGYCSGANQNDIRRSKQNKVVRLKFPRLNLQWGLRLVEKEENAQYRRSVFLLHFLGIIIVLNVYKLLAFTRFVV